jgi:hypothetical protein
MAQPTPWATLNGTIRTVTLHDVCRHAEAEVVHLLNVPGSGRLRLS